MKELKVISFDHKQFSLEDIALLQLDDARRQRALESGIQEIACRELVYINTCNRVEFVLHHDIYICQGQLGRLLSAVFPEIPDEKRSGFTQNGKVYEGEEAFRHLLRMASSLESMVIGEREIITQVRKAFEQSREYQQSGDLLRLVFRKVIEGAKTVYTETEIARRPVSVVSLAWENFKNAALPADSRILFIGAGQMVSNFSRFVVKAGFRRVTVFNRTPEKAVELANRFGGEGFGLEYLPEYTGGFDAIISCTGSGMPVLNSGIYRSLLRGEKGLKHIIDLALPGDVDPDVISTFEVSYTGMTQLKAIAEANISARNESLGEALQIIDACCSEFDLVYRERQIELAMRGIPEEIRKIKETALGVVFSEELNKLDAEAKATLEKIIGYIEKKVVSVPMKMAKDVLLDHRKKS